VSTERHEEEFAAFAFLIRQGASSWVGPSPRARQARWASKAPGLPAALASKRRLPSLVFTALVFFTVVAVAAVMTPGGILTLSRTVSSVVSQKVRGPLSPTNVSPSAAHGSTPTPQPVQSPQPSVSPPASTGGAAPAPAPAATPVDDHGGGDKSGRGGPGPPSPAPSGGSDG